MPPGWNSFYSIKQNTHATLELRHHCTGEKIRTSKYTSHDYTSLNAQHAYQNMLRLPIPLLLYISGRRLADRTIEPRQGPLLCSAYFFNQVDYTNDQIV